MPSETTRMYTPLNLLIYFQILVLPRFGEKLGLTNGHEKEKNYCYRHISI